MRMDPLPGMQRWVLSTAIAAFTVLAMGVSAGEMAQAADEPMTSGGPTTFRRLSAEQYTRSIEDIFGEGISVPGRFEPPLRDEGLLAIGDAKVVVTPSGIEQYELKAREIASQVMTEDRRKKILECEPPLPTIYDEGCARRFVGKYGRLLFRRPLTDEESASVLETTRVTATQTESFYKGLELGLSQLLMSPSFIFRAETSELDPDRAGAQRLDSYSLASRLSFLVWNAPPDGELLDAAARGELHRQKDLERQLNRMLATPKFEQGMRAYFSDMFGYDQFDSLSKDQGIFPKYTSQLAKDAREQSLRTIIDLLVTHSGDYRDLFTTRRTFLNRNLAALYKVPIAKAGVDGWTSYTFGPDDKRAGLLTFAGFSMLDPTHEGRSSPTIRGKSIRELFLCQKVPTPPPNVNFAVVQDTHNPMYKTARERLTAHRDNPTCAGCHALTDPMGLSLENYDAIGAYRADENGVSINTSGTFEGKTYQDAIGLQQVLRDSSSLSNCLVRRLYEYGVGRSVQASEHEWLDYISQRFAHDGHALPGLIRTIAGSKAFRAVSADEVASNQVPGSR
jgi:hypothetical protein